MKIENSNMHSKAGSLKDYWYAAGMSKEFKVGRQVQRTILEIPIVIWRTSENKITAMLD